MRPLSTCPFCDATLEHLGERDNCANCGAALRTRSLAKVVDEVLRPRGPATLLADLPLLAFAMTKQERELLEPVFPVITSVSLYGDYGPGHVAGVDARDLSGFEDGSFSGYFGCLVYDYFVEHESALREAYRVLAPGGVFILCISPGRLRPTSDPPVEIKKVVGRPDYFSYLPDGVALSSIVVGSEWFLETMRQAGFDVQRVTVTEIAAQAVSDWFIGFKPE